MTETPRPPALSGIRVLDLTRVLAGPWCTQNLADLGAEVIKIERPLSGDDTRGWGPPYVKDAYGRDTTEAAYYAAANRNKYSVAVDIASARGADVVRRLACQCDVLVENFKVGGLRKYGLDYDSIRALNPALVYCSITGFGQTGPYANRPGYDFMIQGLGGLMSLTGERDELPGGGPQKAGVAVADLMTGMYSTVAILAALLERGRSGEGQHIDCALLDSQLSLMANQAMNFLVGGQVPQRLGNAHPNVVPYRDFACSDDYILVACGADGQFQALCRLLGRDDLAGDPRFTRNAGRSQHRRELEVELAKTIGTWRAADLLAAMEEAGIPGGPINDLQQALADPHVQARGMLQTLQRQDGTPVTLLGYPAKFSATPPSYRLAPPVFAQDTASLLGEELGLATAQLAELAAKGAIALAQPSTVRAAKAG